MRDLVAALMHPRLAALFAAWREAAESDAAIDPELFFADHADHLLVVETDGVRNRYSHYGLAFATHFGIDLTGRTIDMLPDEILTADRRSMLEFEYAFVHRQGVPLWRSYTAEFSAEGTETWQRLVLPLGDNHRLLVGAYPSSMVLPDADAGVGLLSMLIEKVPLILGKDGGLADLALSLQTFGEGRKQMAAMEALASLDSLTGIANLRHFTHLAEAELAHSRRMGRTYSLLAIDIDHFKRINDGYGHAAGDEALKAFVAACRLGLRAPDILGRCGGEEFGVALPNTDGEGALKIAERLRRLVEQTVITLEPGKDISVTASIGVATLPPEEQPAGDNTHSILRALRAKADQALYRSKEEGRNRVSMAGSDPPTPR
ncbi:MAG TPA: GGDEF domain-containing protein [Rhodospirillaceae bacterium]|nr:GGDEF domain-containing protein [Rhodospirillaceae bacterium]